MMMMMMITAILWPPVHRGVYNMIIWAMITEKANAVVCLGVG